MNEFDRVHYFWFSEKQLEIQKEFSSCYIPHREYKKCTALIDGKVIRYTECCSRSVPFGNWDDYKYLGQGTIHMVGEQTGRELEDEIDFLSGKVEFLKKMIDKEEIIC